MQNGCIEEYIAYRNKGGFRCLKCVSDNKSSYNTF